MVPQPVVAGVLVHAELQTLRPGHHIWNAADDFFAVVVDSSCLTPIVDYRDIDISAALSTVEWAVDIPTPVSFSIRSTAAGAFGPGCPCGLFAILWARQACRTVSFFFGLSAQ
jgi:hypothetical protein